MGERFERLFLQSIRAASTSRWISFLLLPLALFSSVFWAITAVRRAFLTTKAKSVNYVTPVIGVGNITLGGTGKTPFIALLMKHLSGRVGLATRGYRRCSRGLYVTRGENCDVLRAGDEAALIAKRFPTTLIAVSEDKQEAVAALDGQCGAIILDDGLQRYDVPQALQIATIDSGCPDGYGWLLPRGLCREPLSRLRNVDYLVITNADHTLPALRSFLQRFSRPIIVTAPVIHRFFSPDGSTYPLERGQRVALFSGIAHPEYFRRSIESLGLSVVDHLIIRDHGEIDGALLQSFAKKVRFSFPEAVFVGTDKDWARSVIWPDLPLCFSQMELTIIEGHGPFADLLERIRSCSHDEE